MMKSLRVGLVSAGAAVAVFSFGQVTYSLTDLDAADTGYSGAAAINASGQVVGGIVIGSMEYAFVYSSGGMSLIPLIAGSPEMWGSGINDSGQVVGSYVKTSNGNIYAFVYSNGVATDIGTLPGGEPYGAGANAINASGQIVGSSSCTASFAHGGYSPHGFLYSDGVMTDLGSFMPDGDGLCEPHAINDAGQIVGIASTVKSGYWFGGDAFLYSNGVMTDLGTLGGDFSVAYAINAFGQVVGDSWMPGTTRTHGFLYSGGVMSDLGVMPGDDSSGVYGINASGEVIGGSASSVSGTGGTVLWTGGVMYALKDLLDSSGAGWSVRGLAINDSGQIGGVGVSPSGQE